jgi:broad specificity phosphatase PhoE
MAQRLLIVAHAETPATRALMFGDPGELLPAEVRRLSGRIACWVSGPEEACGATAVRLGGNAEPIHDLRACDFGAWTGRPLVDIASDDPSGLDSWLHDPHAAPHGGESLAELINRAGRVLDDHSWPDGRSAAVVTPLVARALLVHALGAAPEVIFRIDIAPLSRALISRNQQTWRLSRLERVKDSPPRDPRLVPCAGHSLVTGQARVIVEP